uniref:Protein FAR1-RELATED SEQUENCE n=1 Tax=Ananas comosus var. bracteatus TaxID=296719 RepID=A0A6V7QR21_ANACO
MRLLFACVVIISGLFRRSNAPDADQAGGGAASSQGHFVDRDAGGTDVIATDVDVDVKNQDPYLRMEFESDAAARAFYNAYASRLGFGIRVARSRSERRKGVEVLVMKRFVCLKEGHHKKKATDLSARKKRKRLSIRDGCPAMMEVVRRAPDRWVVTKLVLDHTHVVVSPDKVREIQLRRLSGKYREHENYLKEMRLRMFGDGDAQVLLDYFKKMQAENPGFFYAIQVDGRNCMANAVWVDAKARISYTYFGDAVTFDTSYKQNENMTMPFAAFTGVNHHGQPVVFGCALVVDKTESSFTWLFETWLTAMFRRHPISLTTDQGKAIGAAVAKVFPQTHHRLCRWRILSRCKKKLSDLYSRFPTLHEELKKCVNECDGIEMFEIYWRSVIDKYDLRENAWLQSLYSMRNKWVPAYLTGSFFAELSTTRKLESINRFYRSHFSTEVHFQTFIAKFDQEMDSRYAEEAQMDNTVVPPEQILKTDTVMEKQAVNIYTRAAFEISKKSWLNPFTTIRHVLGVFFLAGVILLPDHCVSRRWTKKAKIGPEPDGRDDENESYCQSSPILRYNDLVRDAMKCAEKGAVSADAFKVAKDMLRKAFAEIASFEEKLAKSGQHQVKNT